MPLQVALHNSKSKETAKWYKLSASLCFEQAVGNFVATAGVVFKALEKVATSSVSKMC